MKSLFLFLSVLAGISVATACPRADGFPDYNCDGAFKIVVLGDSVVVGTGDTKNGNEGGYVLRAQSSLPAVHFTNLGVAGQRTFELVSKISRDLSRSGSNDFRSAILHADVVFLDLGRNDRWLFGAPETAYKNLKKARSLILSRTKSIQGYSPLVVVASMMLPNRGSQGPWVLALDKLIQKANSLKAPTDLRFDLVSKRLLSTDQIHPTSKGYDALASVFVKYIKKKLPAKLKKLRADQDHDGLYDLFETLKFGTDPTLPDTDGDGILDGEEDFSS